MSPCPDPAHDYSKTAKAAKKKETPPMIHDLVLALVFLAMIIAPALLAMRSEKEEEDIL
jgi:hypothetical protein